MQEKKYTAPDKIVHKMSRDGLTEENLRTGEKQSIHEWQRSRGRSSDGVPAPASETKTQHEAVKKAMVKQYAQKKQQKEKHLQESQQQSVEAGEQESVQKALSQQTDDTAEEESLEAAEDVSSGTDSSYHSAEMRTQRNSYKTTYAGRIAHGKDCAEKETQGGKKSADKAQTKFSQEKAGNKGDKKKTVSKEGMAKKEARLHFDDEGTEFVRGSGMGFHKKAVAATTGVAGAAANRKVSEQTDDNSGVEASHDAEIVAEQVFRQVPRRVSAAKTTEDTVSVKDKTQKFYQKQRYKKAYKEAKRTGKTAENTAAAAQTTFEKIKAVVSNAVRNNRTLLIVLGICGLLFGLIAISVSSASSIVQGLGGAVMTTTYPSRDDDIHQSENAYVALEQALNSQINNMEATHPGYDEYRYQVDEIGHNPYQLTSYLTAVYNDYRYADVSGEVRALFEAQYTLQVTEQVEIRTRTETRTGTTTYTDPETGETEEEEYEYEVEVEYEYYILCISLRNNGFDRVARGRMTSDQIRHYEILNTTYGNRDDLFDLNALPSFDGTAVPVDHYEIPPEALSDTRFANMIREAEKYLGYPYVWGGSSPSTSFDCSGFVCWVLNHCGNGWDVGRTTAEGLRQMCSYVAPSEAKPGDIIFFQGTYDTSGASHVGIYVGDGKMIHCGNPIQYANINTSYWQNHFYMFGRMR